MIIGKGMIAQAFNDFYSNDDEILIFASGVSNSKTESDSEFIRERNLLLKHLQLGKHLVYFSTTSILDDLRSNSPYAEHKKHMENLVISSSKFSIFRLPEIIGKSSNVNTLTNFYFDNIVNNREFSLWVDVKRNLVDIEDVVMIANEFISDHQSRNQVIEIVAEQSTKSLDIIEILESITGIKARYIPRESPIFETSKKSSFLAASQTVKIPASLHYTESILKKYYGR